MKILLPKKINQQLTEQLIKQARPIIYHTIPLEIVLQTTVYVVEQKRGYYFGEKKIITVPAWTFSNKKPEGYPIYYLSHEFAHAVVYTRYRKDWDNYTLKPHGPEFMQAFVQICPPEFQHFEIAYKPRAAKAAGISRNDFPNNFPTKDTMK